MAAGDPVGGDDAEGKRSGRKSLLVAIKFVPVLARLSAAENRTFSFWPDSSDSLGSFVESLGKAQMPGRFVSGMYKAYFYLGSLMLLIWSVVNVRE